MWPISLGTLVTRAMSPEGTLFLPSPIATAKTTNRAMKTTPKKTSPKRCAPFEPPRRLPPFFWAAVFLAPPPRLFRPDLAPTARQHSGTNSKKPEGSRGGGLGGAFRVAQPDGERQDRRQAFVRVARDPQRGGLLAPFVERSLDLLGEHAGASRVELDPGHGQFAAAELDAARARQPEFDPR